MVMTTKRIDEKLYKSIAMAFQYQINCELTPGQCKELLDVIDNPQQVEDECEWKEVWEYTSYDDDDGFWWLLTSCDYKYSEIFDNVISKNDRIKDFIKEMKLTYCPNCGKRIKYMEE